MLPLRDALNKAKKELEKIGCSESYLEAELIIATTLGVGRVDIYKFDYLNEEQEILFYNLLKKRLQGYPIAYIMKKKYFYDLELVVDSNVLIPRPETEVLLEIAFDLIERKSINSVVEIGVGSGNIVIPLARKFPHLNIYACDISPSAIRIAKRNAEKYKVAEKINFYLGPYLYPFFLRKIDFQLIITNPPYVSAREMVFLPQEVKREPWKALYGGFDGCKFYKEIFREMKSLVGGIFLAEISEFIGKKIENLVKSYFNNFSFEIYKDYFGKDRIVKLEWGSILK
ncbi:MAG: protein-(glutamine-N5) methyltransferase, release factor-specific [Dictyoglomus sp. NZ13-RE01]|nr:MAG: protein-(glutamine-N5) methyltransferase, release factor-specific [Dictyoglomus sp. NZ13-RE01]